MHVGKLDGLGTCIKCQGPNRQRYEARWNECTILNLAIVDFKQNPKYVGES